MPFQLVQPDGSAAEFGDGGEITIGAPTLPEGGAVSLTIIEDTDGCLLQNVGTIDVCVEERDDAGEWQLSAFLEPMATTVLGARSRFFAAGRRGAGAFSLRAAASPGAGGKRAAAGASPGSSAGAGGGGKRARADGDFADGGGGGAPDGTGLGGSPGLPTWAPFGLLAVRRAHAPAWAHEGFLGVRLSELVAGDIKFAWVSNMMLDLPWLLSAAPALKAARRIVIVHGEGLQMREAVAAAGIADRTVLHAPPTPIEYGTHHTKAFILHLDGGLRVIIHTANAIYPDFGNKTQAVWWQDFPPKDAASPPSSAFESDLGRYLAALCMPPAAAREARALLAAHDFSAARAHLLPSVPGYHRGAAAAAWGLPRAAALLAGEEFGAEFAGGRSALAAQFSSIGSLTEKWVATDFVGALSGGRVRGTGAPLGPVPADALALVWPAAAEVQNSVEGWAAGRSIPGPAKNVDKPFLAARYRRWGGAEAGRQRCMPHIKSYCRYEVGAPGAEGGGSGSASGGGVAWFIVASHNLSKAAWGERQRDGSQTFMRSYELGVLVTPGLEAAHRASRWHGFSAAAGAPPPAPAAEQGPVRFVRWRRGASQRASARPDGVVEVPLPVPYALPPARYGDGEQPWAVDRAFGGLDTYGCRIGELGAHHYGLLDGDDWEAVMRAAAEEGGQEY